MLLKPFQKLLPEKVFLYLISANETKPLMKHKEVKKLFLYFKEPKQGTRTRQL